METKSPDDAARDIERELSSRCPRCQRRDVQFYPGRTKINMCITCWRDYQRGRYEARRITRGLAYVPRPSTAAADLVSCMRAWR